MKKGVIVLSIIFSLLVAGSFALADYCSKDSDCGTDITKDNSCVNSTAPVTGCGAIVGGCNISYSSNPADYCKCEGNKCVGHKNDSTAPGCENLYWIDNDNRECGQKEFCGTYMYLGLFTFENETACQQYVLASSGGNINNSDCKNLYWFDNENKSCGQKQFCGAYMYYGLRTFKNKTACENALGINKSCAKAGEPINPQNLRGKTDYADECCEGLTVANGYSLNKSGGCEILTGNPYGWCIPCGNGICDRFESIKEDACNCPQDCGNCPENTTNEDNKCMFLLSNGRKAEVKIMPETASQTAIAKLGDLGFNVELKEIGKGDNAKPTYELTGKKQGKFLGIFKIMASEKVQVDAETGDTKVIKPWWSFLASGI